jgi:hypothetical protein
MYECKESERARTMFAGAGAVRIVTLRTKRQSGHALAVSEVSTACSRYHLEAGQTEV